MAMIVAANHGPARPTSIPNGSISSGGRTGTSPSAPESISASAISSRASRRPAPAGAVHALAEAEARGRAVGDPLAQASRAALDREAAGHGLMIGGSTARNSHAMQMNDR